MGVSHVDIKDAIVTKPADQGTLSADEGEGRMARGPQRNLGAEDPRSVEGMLRMYCGVAFSLQEATLRVQRLRNLFFGRGRKARRPPAPEVSAPSSQPLGEGAGGGASAPLDEHAACARAVGCDAGVGTSQREAPPQATGGHRAGMGRLGADASMGASRVECHHEELSVGQRGPVCGQGT
jgi:hypothetical protein